MLWKMIQLEGSLLAAGGLDRMPLEGPLCDPGAATGTEPSDTGFGLSLVVL